MFLSFFIWQFQLFLKFLPFIIALSWIMISALYDLEFVLYQSLLLCVFFYFVDLIERFLSHYFSVDKQILFSIINSTTLAVLFANIIGLSSGITKSVSDSWLKKTTTVTYGFIIQLIEPLLMLIEMIQIITFILNFGETLRSKIFDEDNSSSSSLYKIITILLTLVNSLLAFWIIWCDTIQNEQLLLMKISTIILMGMAMAVYIYNIYHEYIIVDASFVWLYVLFIHHLVLLDWQRQGSGFHQNESTHSQIWPKLVDSEIVPSTDTHNGLSTFISTIESIFADCKKGFVSIAFQMKPLFWIAFILRIKCLTSFFEGELCQTIFMPTNDDDADFDENFHRSDTNLIFTIGRILKPSRSALLRSSFIIAFTMILMQHFTRNPWYIMAHYQWIIRLLQTYSTPIFYMFAARAFHQSDDFDYEFLK
uniref:Uncharacterized protein LOC113791893 n=2 Tax=Dermatophagoides pteronyssinus TaxID=6956 RepID=A0A6P6XWU9_DERPT|nr:uncharacterized protein LOC113791893 [Dermatophagoides pteronyssinus]